MKKITTLLLVYLICIGSMGILISFVPQNVKAEDINPVWHETWGGSWNDEGYGVTDYEGYLYVAGNRFVDWDNPDIFLLKYDTTGNLIWNRTWGGYGSDYAYGITGCDGYLYLTGKTGSSGAGDTDVLLLKYDTDGNMIWNRTWGGNGSDYGYGITEYDSYLYVTGRIDSSGVGSGGVLLLKYDTDGKQIWNKTWGLSEKDRGHGITGYGGYLYVLSEIWKGDMVGEYKVVLLKYDTDGNQIWSTIWHEFWGGSYGEGGYGITEYDGYLYMIGESLVDLDKKTDVLLLKYDIDGNQIWNKTWGGNDFDYGFGITEYDSYIYVIGRTDYGAGENFVLLLKYDIDGNQIWNKTWGGNGSDYGYGIAEYDGYLYLTGGTNSSGAWDNDVLLLKCGTELQVPSAPQNLQATSGDGYVNLTWNPPADNGGSAITNYKIYRGTTSGGETLLTTVGNVLTYTDSSVTNNQIYYYKVSAVNGIGEGNQSAEASATPTAGGGNGSDYTPGFELITMLIATTLAFALITFSRRRKK